MSKLLKINPGIPIIHGCVMGDLRNRVIPSYDTVDETIIWKIIMKNIPVLLIDLQNLPAS